MIPNMTPDNILILVAILVGGAELLWVAIKTRKDNLGEDYLK